MRSILEWSNSRKTVKINMHKEEFRINPIVYEAKINIKFRYSTHFLIN